MRADRPLSLVISPLMFSRNALSPYSGLILEGVAPPSVL